MHRSGTSAVARSLECLGAELGHFAAWSGPDNPDFAEDQHVLAMNNYLLRRHGFDWYSPTIPYVHDEGLRLDAVMLLRDKLSAYPLFALKEPRLCRLLPFWRPVFAAVGCDVSVVEVVRHPSAVAASLFTRNGIRRPEALGLWLDHVGRAREDRDPAWPWVTVEYDEFVEQPSWQMQRIGKAIGLPMHKHPHVRRELRHHVTDHIPLPRAVAHEWIRAEERARA